MKLKKTILLVDDEQEILDLNKEAFEHFGFSVVTASSVPDAINALEAYTIDYILSDYTMPVQNGLELVKIVRHKMHLKMPISFLTANTLSAFTELNELGVQKVFPKPLDIDEVVVFVQNALK